MSDKEYFERLVSSSIDGALTEKEKEKLGAHLKECPSCAALKNDLERMRELFMEGADSVRFPDTLHENIMANVRKEARVKVVTPEKPVRRLPVFTMVVVAAAVVLAVLGGGLGQIFTMFGDNSGTSTASVDEGIGEMAPEPESVPETGGGGSDILDHGGAYNGSAEISGNTDGAVMYDEAADEAPMAETEESTDEESAYSKSSRVIAPDIEFPDSLKGMAVSHCYIARSPDAIVDIDGELVANENGASYFLLDNSTSPVEETIVKLEQAGCTVEAYEDVGLVIDNKEDNWLLILN